jgi:RNA polymerase sigma-70 factor (ECF subfamily)
MQSLLELAGGQREALDLHYLLDMSVEQVAQELGRPINIVKTHLAPGRATLPDALRDGVEHEHRH